MSPERSSSSSQYTYSSSASTSSLSAAATVSSSASTSSLSSQYTYSNGTYFPAQIHLQQQPPPPYIGAAPPPVQLPYPSVYPAIAATPGVYTLPQFQQAQQLFHRDAQTITPEALENVKAALASSETEHRAKAKKRGVPRKAAGKCWKDPTLAQWPLNDYRLFCGDLGNEVNEDVLSKAFSKFPSFNMAKVLRDKRTGKTKGFGFVSFSSPLDFAAALKGMNGKYVGNRPIKLCKSNWQERNDNEAQKHTRTNHIRSRR
ncbi:RNA-binding protein 42-like isoform X1 [Solanum tuberosum]|uniref:RNA-binding protein 42-like isoform X1 n=1 Tax=Solanum tuberosum TaxID=4113 RepID=UPI0003D26910|nr:PREDICTED: RNA-binding protein 42-like isoform X1 [Solanum tuberosum]